MNRSAPHTRLVHAIRKGLGLDRRVVLWLNPVGDAETKRGFYITFGLCTGSSDIIGILRPSGRFLALEAKTGDAAPTADQRDFLDLVRNAGGFGCVVHSVDEARAAVDRAASGANE